MEDRRLARELQLQAVHQLEASPSGGETFQPLSDEPLCLCSHPRQPNAVLGGLGSVVEFDLLSGCRLGSADALGTPVCLSYSADGGKLYALLAERALLVWTLPTWKRRVLMELPAKSGTKPMHSAIMALGASSKPPVYFCEEAATAVRLALSAPPVPVKGQKAWVQGSPLKGDLKKPILAMAALPSDPYFLLLLTADGQLSGCSINKSARTIAISWSKAVEDGIGFEAGVLQAAPHPVVPGGALMLVGTSGGTVGVWEAGGKLQPHHVGTHHLSGQPQVAAVGFSQAGSHVLAFSRISSAGLLAHAFHLLAGPSGSSWVGLKAVPPLLLEACQGADASQGHGEFRQADGKGANWRGLWGGPLGGLGGSSSAQAITAVAVHPVSGLVIAQTEEAYGQPRGVVRQSAMLRGTVLRINNCSRPAAAAGLPVAAPLHTGLHFWKGSGDSVSKKLSFPRRMYFLDNYDLAAFTPHTGQAAPVAALPTANAGRAKLAPVSLLHSPKRLAWLLFFQVVGIPGSSDSSKAGNAAAVPRAGSGEFTLAFDAPLPAVNWTAPGASGVFAGQEDEYVAVLDSIGAQVRIYATKESKAGPPPVVRALEVFPPGAYALFPGPAWSSLPRPESTGQEQGPGIVAWTMKSGALAISNLTGGSGADTGGLYSGLSLNKTGRRTTLGLLRPEKHLPLLPGEGVLQVAWQSLVEAGEGSVMDDSGAGKASTVGVVLTPGRALLVTVTLLPLATASADRAGSPFTSCLWLGPALLLSTASHQVVQMAWDGSLVRVCSLGGGPPSVLGGALAERLLVVRGGAGAGPGGQAEVSQRHVPLLGPLLAGWASLAASNILPGGLWRARQEMGQLLRSYDASGIDQELIKALTSAGCADVAAILAATDSASQVEPQLKTAVQAAAGQWRDAVTAAAAQHRASIFHPKPWPKGSQQAQRLIALGRAALAYGHVSAAQELWGLAGNWAELLPLAALQADFGTVRRLSAQAQGNPQARNIASALIAGSEPRIKRAAAVGARALPGDWRVEIETDLPDVVPLAGAAMLAPPGAAPSMEAAAGLGVNEAPASIPQMDSALLQAYLGVGQGNVRGAVLQAPAQREATEEEEAAFAAPAPTEEEDGSLEGTEDKSEAGTSTSAAAAANDPQAAARAAFMDAMPGEAGSSDDEGQDKSTRAGNLQPAASDASFTSTSTGVGQTQRFKVVIRDRAEALAADPGNDALRAAAQGLKLAPLIPLPSPRASGPLPPAKAAAKKPAFAFKAQADSSSDEESGSQTNRRAAAPPGLPRTSAQAKQPPAASAQPPVFDPFPEGFAAPPTLQLAPAPAVAGSSQAPREIPEDLFTATPKKADAQTSALAPSLPSASAGPSRMAPQPAQPAAVARPSAPARAPAAAAPPGPSLAAASPAMKAGMAAMEAGSWQRAAAELGSALSQARAGSPEGAQAAQYLAAVLLLQECGKAEKVTGARLTRYAAALPLDLSHRRALVQSAIARNMDVANYEYAVEQLTWLVVQSTGTASPAYLASLQQRIEQCDRAGGRNARLPDDEDTSSLADIVASASSSADINDCICALLA